MTAGAPLNKLNFKTVYLQQAAALILGCLLPLAFAPFFLWPLAILIPAALLWLIDNRFSPGQLFLSGWLFGLGYFGFGVYWIYNSLHDFGMAPPIVAASITGLLVMILALMPALTLSLTRHTQRYLGAVAIWMLPLFWFSLEWFKGWVLTGMPWLSLGYSQTGSPLAGFAPLIGVYGISALCIIMAIAMYRFFRDRQGLLLLPILLIPILGWMLQMVDWTRPQANELKVTLVQGNIPQQLKWRRDQRQNIFNTYWRETQQAWDSDLIIWPETALPGRSEEIEGSILTPMRDAAIAQESTIVTGLIHSDDQAGKLFNSAIMLGKNPGIYHKRHLVMFGEYYPMRWLLDLMSGLINIPYSDLTPGPEEQELMVVDGNTLGLSICFEDVFSRDILFSMPDANLLVNLSNDAWFGDSTAPHQHMQIAQMRSLEFERFMIRATNTGVSAFVDHKGKLLTLSEQFKSQSLTHLVRGRNGVTPFYYFAHIQGWLALLVLVIPVILARRKTG